MSVDRRMLPVPEPPPGIRFPDLAESQLASGVRLVSLERRELPLVSLLWLWHAGTSADRDEAPGLAALTADLLDEGTATLTMTALHEALAGIGGQLDTDIGHDATVLSMLALSSHRERAIELFVDMAERPRLEASDMARVQALRLTRLRQLRHSASALADLLFMRRLYGTHPYGRPGIGTEASLQRFTVDDVRAYHQRLGTTPATLVIVGDIAHEEAVRLVSRHLSGEARVGHPDPVAPIPAEGSRLLFVPRDGAAQS
ncbi:MAG: insulinase family protein, partial [Actinomycetota bacterium]|nr:insulinase family protein [Actinomycetota bacterium]